VVSNGSKYFHITRVRGDENAIKPQSYCFQVKTAGEAQIFYGAIRNLINDYLDNFRGKPKHRTDMAGGLRSF
jgi:hypothetical protein